MAEYTEGILQTNLSSGIEVMCTICGTNTVTVECLPCGIGVFYPDKDVTQHIIKQETASLQFLMTLKST